MFYVYVQALYHIAVLWASTVAVEILFYHVNSMAGYFTIPYFVWVTFIMVLNYGFYRNNKKILDTTTVEEKC
jgi:tryptophan-rich sensory protein